MKNMSFYSGSSEPRRESFLSLDTADGGPHSCKEALLSVGITSVAIEHLCKAFSKLRRKYSLDDPLPLERWGSVDYSDHSLTSGGEPVTPADAASRIRCLDLTDAQCLAIELHAVSVAACTMLQQVESLHAESDRASATANQRNALQRTSDGATGTPGRTAAVRSPQTTPLIRVADVGSGGRQSFDSQAVFSMDQLRSTRSDLSAVLVTDHLEQSIDPVGFKMINNKYTVIDDLGHGSFGKVKLAVDEQNKPVAIKILQRHQVKLSVAVDREIAVMKKLHHRNVVRLHEVIDDPSVSKLYLVMQYVDGGPVVKIRPEGTCVPIPEVKVRDLAQQLLSGLSYLHKRRVTHRDIKPDNILVGSDGTPYFSDFGVSEILEGEAHDVRTLQGTIFFVAPELLKDRGEICADAFASDVWSLGVTFYAMLFGTLPFHGTSRIELIDAILHQPLSFPPDATPGWQELLAGMLHREPDKRWSLKQAKHCQALRVGSAEGLKPAVTDAEVRTATVRVTNFLPMEDPPPLTEAELLGGGASMGASGSRPSVVGVRDVLSLAHRDNRSSSPQHLSLHPPAHRQSTAFAATGMAFDEDLLADGDASNDVARAHVEASGGGGRRESRAVTPPAVHVVASASGVGRRDSVATSCSTLPTDHYHPQPANHHHHTDRTGSSGGLPYNTPLFDQPIVHQYGTAISNPFLAVSPHLPGSDHAPHYARDGGHH